MMTTICGPERREYFVGLDLGKRRDHAAMAVVERVSTVEDLGFDPVKWERQRRLAVSYQVRWLKQAKLGMTYPDVVRWARGVTEELAGLGRPVSLVVDATGLGDAVVDMLREAGLRAAVVAVTITGAGTGGAHRGDGVWLVPRVDLLGALRVGLESGEVRVAAAVQDGAILKRELGALRERQGRVESAGSEHDDVAMAVALACWWGRARRERVVEPGAYLPV